MELLILACFVGLAVSEVPPVAEALLVAEVPLVAEAPLELSNDFDEKKPPIVADYHSEIGIPEAARIKAIEEASDFSGSRIVGGSAAHLGQYPYLGGLLIALTDGRQSVCGSSLISNTKLVTAAHCWRSGGLQAARFTVVLGSIRLYSGGTRINTNNCIMHPNYNQVSLHNDIAVITIRRVGFNNNIRNVALASGNNNFAGSWAWAAGFGAQWDGVGIGNNQALHHVSVQIINNNVCQNVYGGSVIASTLCVATTGGRGTCGGDSGGPLTVSGQLVGVTSFGHRSGCQRGYPAGFARVTSFRNWIVSHM